MRGNARGQYNNYTINKPQRKINKSRKKNDKESLFNTYNIGPYDHVTLQFLGFKLIFFLKGESNAAVLGLQSRPLLGTVILPSCIR